MTRTEERINKLFEELVPSNGKADTVAGEIIRATCRIGYRYMNDGDQIGIDYGRETVNPAARYLMKKCADTTVETTLIKMWELYDETLYEERLEDLEEAVLLYIEQHPNLKTKENPEDMWDYRDEYEDVDEYDADDEDDEEYEDDEEQGWR